MNIVRITSGKYKGRKITTPGGSTHPMGERERMALLNMLSPYIDEARVLDAFAGSGALGIEALSRGAKEVIFVEKNTDAARTIKKNLQELGIEAEVVKSKVSNYAHEKSRTDGQISVDTATNGCFGIIVADPPYDDFRLEEVASLAPLLNVGGVFALSHPGEAPEIEGLELIKSNRYAGAHISIYNLA